MSKAGPLLILSIGVLIALVLIGVFVKLAAALFGLIITVTICLCAGAIGFVSTMWAMGALSEKIKLGSVIPFAVGAVVFAFVAGFVNSLAAFFVIGCLATSACNALAVAAVRTLNR